MSPCICAHCGFLRQPSNPCGACGYTAAILRPWDGPKEYWRSNGQASVSLGHCETPEDLEHSLRESQGTADWRGWSCG